MCLTFYVFIGHSGACFYGLYIVNNFVIFCEIKMIYHYYIITTGQKYCYKPCTNYNSISLHVASISLNMSQFQSDVKISIHPSILTSIHLFVQVISGTAFSALDSFTVVFFFYLDLWIRVLALLEQKMTLNVIFLTLFFCHYSCGKKQAATYRFNRFTVQHNKNLQTHSH